jgi:FAD/FMN-containing dehydrogenase
MTTIERPRDSDPRTNGVLVTPEHPRWNDARRAWDPAVDQRPAAVAFPESIGDIAAVLDLARSLGMRVAPQCTGRSAGAIPSLHRTILLRTSDLRGVVVDPRSQVVRVDAGARWSDVIAAAAADGLAAPAATSPEVGVVGSCLGGGLSWVARSQGLACRSVRAVELLTADGELVRVTADDEPGLFWALRGGGGSFGVVTAMELALLPVSHAFGGALLFPLERAHRVLQVWCEWAATVPETVSSAARLLHLPGDLDVPAALRGRSLVAIEAVALTAVAESERLLRPLRGLGPALDSCSPLPLRRVGNLRTDADRPAGMGGGSVVVDLPPEAIDAVVAALEPGPRSALQSVEIRHLGGALSRPAQGHGALDALGGTFLVHGTGRAEDIHEAGPVAQAIADLRTALGPWEAVRSYPDVVERPADPSVFFSTATWTRLRGVKTAVDPSDRICAAHPISPNTTALGPGASRTPPAPNR